jgi:hypothetical protein
VRGVLWVARMFIVGGYLMACHSPYLFNGEGVLVRYISYCAMHVILLICSVERGC